MQGDDSGHKCYVKKDTGAATTEFVSTSDSRVVGQVYMYCNWKIIVCRLLNADQQRYTDKFKSLCIDKCPYEISRSFSFPTKWHRQHDRRKLLEMTSLLRVAVWEK